METVTIDEVPRSVQPATVMRPLTEALGSTDLALNYYELEPGDSFAYAYHEHEVQEEVFYVQRGTATFETEDGDVEVAAGEVVRFPPGEFQRGWNRGDERVVALAMGAPLEYGEQVKLRECEACGERTDHDISRVEDGEAVVATCGTCGERNGRWTLDSNPPGN
jgi:uncharacterized cupin superfamily protein